MSPDPRRRDDEGDALDDVVARALAGPKYRAINPDLARRVGAIELAKAASVKDAVKATRSRLHQVAGAYLDAPRYDAWLAELREGLAQGREMGLRALRRVMGRHASTRERLPDLDQFYPRALGGDRSVKRVLDLACGLNPLTLPWLALDDGAEYLGCDIYSDLAEFVNTVFTLPDMSNLIGHIHVRAENRDILSDPPGANVDLVLLLKAIPCLEQADREAGARLLNAIRAPRILVSYPLRTLGGRSVGMAFHYDEAFHALLARVGGASWRVTRQLFSAEITYLIER